MAYDIGTVDVNTFPEVTKCELLAGLAQFRVYKLYYSDIMLGHETFGFLLEIALACFVAGTDFSTLKETIVNLRAAGVTIFPNSSDMDIVQSITDLETLQSDCQTLFDADHDRVKAIYA